MIKSLELINSLKTKKDIPLKEAWLFYLTATNESNYNIEHLNTVKELSNKLVLDYVRRTLTILNRISNEEVIPDKLLYYVEETLKWSEVAKCGYKRIRKDWLKKGYDLKVHNIGSYYIYKESKNYDEIVAILIKTHGLIGQYIRGEVNFSKNKELLNLLKNNLINKEDLRKVLLILNQCIIEAVSSDLYLKIKEEIVTIIDKIIEKAEISENFEDMNYIIKRFNRLRKTSFNDDYQELEKLLKEEPEIKRLIGLVFKNLELWYFESALYNFSLEEAVKIMMLVGKYIENNPKYEHLTFEKVMKTIYLDYNDRKVINIYKARIIENYLGSISYQDIISNNVMQNPHIKYDIEASKKTISFNFLFSDPANKLIEFCEAAYDRSELYSKAVFLLYDLFGFRRDTYDRFYNEIDYLNTMNASLMHKSIILDYLVGKNILDIGPGGGSLMDLILEKNSKLNVTGIDISQNVIEELSKKQKQENKAWHLVKGDALNLSNYFPKGTIDTIIYSSIIHELFSYIETDGRKFNHDTIRKAIKSAYEILPIGGRIIIRDGVMSEPVNAMRIIKFHNKDDMDILKRYCNDFEGRKVDFETLADDKVKMKINDAMEFLYTYTWGEKSYPLEVKEQFGYFTPDEYVKFIKEVFNNKCKIIECRHFLQDGYSENLLNRIGFYDENGNITKLPDSTIILVVEKL